MVLPDHQIRQPDPEWTKATSHDPLGTEENVHRSRNLVILFERAGDLAGLDSNVGSRAVRRFGFSVV
jgi:hypothetical protein